MRTTIDLPVDIYRKAKAEAALRGVKFRDMIVASLSRELNRPDNALSQTGSLRADEFMASLDDLAGQIPPKASSAMGRLFESRTGSGTEPSEVAP